MKLKMDVASGDYWDLWADPEDMPVERPVVEAMLALCDAHLSANDYVVTQLEKTWGASDVR